MLATHIRTEDRYTFRQEALAHVGISGIAQKIATLLIATYGVRQVSIVQIGLIAIAVALMAEGIC